MASSARIEELEKKFTENPRRYFAPLANEYRKAGDLEQAIAICRAYVPQQPAHMSGHVVFGQALFEAGQHDEAQGVLEAALALDPENLIALRHLGDIARARGEVNAARGWYRRVLDADPRNEDVAALVKSLDSAPGTPPAKASAPIQVDEFTNWAEINPERTLELPPGILDSISRDVNAPDAGVVIDVAPSIGAQAESSMTLEQMLQPAAETHGERTGDAMGLDFMGPATSGEPAPGAGGSDSAATESIAGLEVMEFVPPTQSTGGSVADVVDPLLGHPAPNSLAPAAASAPRRDADAPTRNTPASSPAASSPIAFVPPAGAPLPAAPAASNPAAGAPAPTTPAASAPAIGAVAANAPAAFVTETMAELYLQQGFRDEALHVYRQLLEQDPRDPTLRERVQQLERDARPTGAAATAVAGTASVATTVTTPTSVTAAVTEAVVESVQSGQAIAHGPTVRDFFSALATRSFGSLQSSATSDTSDGDVGAVVETASTEALAPANSPTAEAVTPPPASPDASSMDVPSPSLSSDELSAELGSEEELVVEDDDGDIAEMDALSGFGFGSAPVGPPPRSFEYDVRAYDAADMSGQHRATSAQAMDGGAEPDGASALGAPLPPSPAAPGPDGEFSGMPRKPMQTGSVNVLFPGQSIPVPDETAAATLSSAFGGPTQTGAPTGAAARPAPAELSLDSIFRDAAPPAEPRRESSAFSFDQFFGESPARSPGGAPTPRDRPATPAKDEESGDAEQFSNWLSGLKKK